MIIYLSPSNENKVLKNDILEKDIARNICNNLEIKLKEGENKVYICDCENTVYENIEESERLNADIYVCIHISKNLNKRINVITNNNSLSRKFAKNMLQQLKLIYRINNFKEDIQETNNIIELNKSYIPIVFIEFPSDEESIKWLLYKQNDVVEAINRAINIYNGDKS